MQSETILNAYVLTVRRIDAEANRPVDVAPSMIPERFTRLLRQRVRFRDKVLAALKAQQGGKE